MALATAGGAGLAPLAPGTAGSLVGVAIALPLIRSGSALLYLTVALVLLAAGVWSAGHVEVIYGHDASRIVIDEVVGQMITLAAVMWTVALPATAAWILGFLLFRFFDILKPFPLRRLERLPRGLGVMADDVGAGIYGLSILMLLEFMLVGAS